MTRLRRGSAVVCLCLLGLFVGLTLPVILSGRGGTSEAGDQANFHLPTVMAFAGALPRPDLRDYPSATAPGHHLVLALVARLVSPDARILQLANSLASACLLAVAWAVCARFAGPALGAALVLPLVFSSYFIGGAIWITTDNAALAMVALAVAGAVLGPPAPRRFLGAGVAAAAAVAVRQIHLWTAGVVALSALLASPLARRVPGRLGLGAAGPWSNLAAGLVGALLPAAVASALVWLWGGLTPPLYRDMHDTGINPAAWPFALALAGCFGVFFVPRAELRRLRRLDPMLLALVAGAVVLSLLWPTSFARGSAGRWGGALWELVRVAPTVADRSVVLPFLAGAGACCLYLLARGAETAGNGRQARLLLVAAALWLLTQSFSTQLFQRYYEPWLLVTLAWLAALCVAAPARRAWVGPVLLAGIQSSLAVHTVLMPVLRYGLTEP